MKTDSRDPVRILGVRVDAVTVEDLHREIGGSVASGGRATFLNANVHCLNLAVGDEEFRRVLNGADLVFCDGYGVMLASRMLGRGLPQRITYADWLPALCEFAASRGFSLYFLGAGPEVAREAARRLTQRYPDLRIVGTGHGYFDPEDERDSAAVVEAVNAADPDILVVGMGMPLQEKWLARNRDRLNARVALTGGAVFDYASGRLRRGPRLLTDNGFEWLVRLAIEPGRLWRRYLLGNPLFLLRVLGQVAGRRSRTTGYTDR